MSETSEPLLQDCSKCGTSIDVTDAEPFARMHCPGCGETLRVRRQFDHFEIEEALGSGGMGTVYRAMDHNLHRSVALKLLRKELSSDPEFIRQFEHEAAITALITHPNVVKVYSTGADRGHFFIAMELVDKGSLDDLMTNDGTVPELKCLEVGIQIAQGLLAALKCGLIHRDVKPGNILFADARSSKIVDFGLAVRMDQAGTVGGEIWGTPYYVAPEKLANLPEDFRSDMYSLAATLYHAITGEPPCETEEATINTLLRLKKTLRPIEKVAPGVASETAYVINRALSFDPDERHQSYEDFIEHLEYAHTVVRKREMAAAKAARQVPTAIAEKRRAWSWVTVGMLAAVALGGSAVYVYRDAIFRPSNTVVVDGGTKVEVLSAEQIYQAGRVHFIKGDFGAAAAEFANVQEAPGAGHPLMEWAAVHEGLTQLLRGDEAAADATFQTLADAKPYSHEPGKAELARFFGEIGAQVAKETAIPSAAQFPEGSIGGHRAILPFVWASKAWCEGRMELAASLFRKSPGAGGDVPVWIAEYKDLADRLANEADRFRRVELIWTSATTEREREATIPKIKEAAENEEGTGWSNELLRKLHEKASSSVAAEKAERIRLEAERLANDRKTLDEARKVVDVLLAQFKYEEAHAAVMSLQMQSEEGRRGKELMLKRMEWLKRFKITLVSSLIRHGYAGPVSGSDGKKLADAATGASRNGLKITTGGFGDIEIPWVKVSAADRYKMALALLNREPQGQADRQWQLGIYALQLRRNSEGIAWLRQAAQMKAEYAKELADALAAFGLTQGATAPTPNR